MKTANDIILRPLMSEKSSVMTEASNRYAFEVAKSSTKYDVKNAVESYFNVRVLKVHTLVIPGRVKRIGKHTKRVSSHKKAYVTLKSGQKIELFKGV